MQAHERNYRRDKKNNEEKNQSIIATVLAKLSREKHIITYTS